ncbi:hypothetical protein, partial [Streptomyces sp. NPDC059900]|uniref:hypothetical protein n=1 Tax=Streptomyces sp. NPDC059900 TaxID=3155816 RepID=UPI003D089AB6
LLQKRARRRFRASGSVLVMPGYGCPMLARLPSTVDQAKVMCVPTGSGPRFTVQQILDAVHGDYQESHGRQEQKSDN